MNIIIFLAKFCISWIRDIRECILLANWVSSVSRTGCKLGHRKDHASSFFPFPFLLISLLLQLWYYLLFEQLKIRVVLDQVCHSCPSAPPLARPWCLRPQKQLALVCALCPICCAFCLLDCVIFFCHPCEGVRVSKVWSHFSSFFDSFLPNATYTLQS